MSNTDSFIEEVTEEVRRDRLFSLLKRWGWVGVVVVVAIVGGAGWNEWRKAQAEAEAQALGDALYAALDANASEDRADALSSIEAQGSAGAIRGLLLAAEQEEAGDVPAAIASLEAVVTDAEVPQDYRDLAALKSLMLSAGTMDEETRRAALGNLARPGQTFRLAAMEQVALSHVRAGETEAALERLFAIIEDAETGEALRDRAQSLIIALGGEVSEEGGAGN